MLIAGFLGGLTNIFFTENLQNQRIDRKFINQSLMGGIAASLLVPLFLNTLESNLVDNLINSEEKNINNEFIFFGFCLLAAISARPFIRSLTNKILLDTQKQAKKAINLAVEASNTVSSQNHLINELKENINQKEISNLIQLGKFAINSQKLKEALELFEDVLKKDQNNFDALVNKSRALKRIGISNNDEKYIIEALKINDNIMNNILDVNDDNKYQDKYALCLYNKACYTTQLYILKNQEIQKKEIKEYLNECFKLAPRFVAFAVKDSDFNSFIKLDWFQELCNRYMTIDNSEEARS